jgi:membrane protease YdiL (CAAX protease family)
MTLAVLAGVALARRVGLRAPATEAWANGRSYLGSLMPQFLPGVIVGLVGGAAIVVTWIVSRPFLTPDFIRGAEQFNKALPHITRFLYGGLTEELLLRWGVMTLMVWAAWRVLQKGKGPPRTVYVTAAIVLSSLLFGVGHLPVASMLNGGLTVPLMTYVITSNSIFGIAAGFLYWRRGLEAAMLAHIFAHVVLIITIALAF